MQELKNEDSDKFTKAYGDSFVRGLQTGGEFYTVSRITSVSMSKQTELTASLHAVFNGFVALQNSKRNIILLIRRRVQNLSIQPLCFKRAVSAKTQEHSLQSQKL